MDTNRRVLILIQEIVMRIIIVVSFVIVSAYVGLNIVKGFTDVVKNHNQRIERAAGY